MGSTFRLTSCNSIRRWIIFCFAFFASANAFDVSAVTWWGDEAARIEIEICIRFARSWANAKVKGGEVDGFVSTRSSFQRISFNSKLFWNFLRFVRSNFPFRNAVCQPLMMKLMRKITFLSDDPADWASWEKERVTRRYLCSDFRPIRRSDEWLKIYTTGRRRKIENRERNLFLVYATKFKTSLLLRDLWRWRRIFRVIAPSISGEIFFARLAIFDVW